MPAPEARDWLAASVLGLGYKESSHFLRNIGFEEFAIIDFHIIDLLAREKLIRKPRSKSLPKKKYLRIEKALGRIAKRVGMSQGELDLYLWYMETGKILK
jgi:N-glycosylase/DNA lyase